MAAMQALREEYRQMEQRLSTASRSSMINKYRLTQYEERVGGLYRILVRPKSHVRTRLL